LDGPRDGIARQRGAEWGIKKNDKYLLYGEINNTGKILIDNIDTLKGARTLYIGGLNLNSIEIPINYGMHTEYLVTLSKRMIYLDEGELDIKVLNKDDELILKIRKAKNYIGFNTMRFYLQ
jgi:hypothetical protein